MFVILFDKELDTGNELPNPFLARANVLFIGLVTSRHTNLATAAGIFLFLKFKSYQQGNNHAFVYYETSA